MKALAFSLMTAVMITMVVASPANAEIAWQSDLRAAHTQAQAEGKLLLLHFTTDNCSWCDKLEAGAFKDPSVGGTISQGFVPVMVHAGKNPKLAEMFKVSKFPTDVVVTVEGKTLAHGVSPQEPRRYIAMLSKAMPAALAETSPPAEVSSPANINEQTDARIAEAQMPPAGNPTPPAVANKTWELPGGPAASANPSGSSNSVATGKLVGSRTDTLSLSMPDQIAAPEKRQVAVTPSVNASALSTPAPADDQSAQAGPPTESSKATKSVVAATKDQVSADPELAMDGFCAVTVVKEATWVEGSPEFGVIHLGKLYLFSSREKMQKFLDDPIPYTPVLNEIDVVRFFEERVIVRGKREWAMQDPFNKRMFFFADEAAMLHFEKEYDRYVDTAISVMDQAVAESNPM